MSESTELPPAPVVYWVGTPSNWKLVIAKPRALNRIRLESYCWTLTPGVWAKTSATVIRLKSSIRWRVNTVSDWGVSRRVSGSLVAVLAPLTW